MVQTESLPSTRHFREKVREERLGTAGVWKSHYRFYIHKGKLPSRVVRDWHYTPRFNVSQTLNVAVSRCAVIPEWPCSMLGHEGPIPTTGRTYASFLFFHRWSYETFIVRYKFFLFFDKTYPISFPTTNKIIYIYIYNYIICSWSVFISLTGMVEESLFFVTLAWEINTIIFFFVVQR